MKFSKVLENTVRSLSGLKLMRRSRISGLDLAVLEVALMVAALDGKVQKDETDAFLSLAGKCRGANPKSIAAAYEVALRAAGYISILVQVQPEEKVLAAFADEVVKVMPESFLMANPEDVRRAFVVWVAMAMSDGDYSGIERRAIDLLVEHFAIVKSRIFQSKLDGAMAMSPAFRGICRAAPVGVADVSLLPVGFLAEVEKKLANSSDVDIASLIKG